MYRETARVAIVSGIHARPAAIFVTAAGKFKSEIWLEKNGTAVNAKSIISVIALGAQQKSTVTVRAEGPDEKEAVKALIRIIRTRYPEEDKN